MELLQLKYFIEAARWEHFTKAADALYITQPALSLSISRLEKELNTTLFERRGQGVQLNRNGELFYQYAVRMTEELQAMRQELAEFQSGLLGEVRLGTVQPVSSFGWLTPIMNNYKTQHPNVSLSVFTGPQPILLELLDERKLAVAFTTGTVSAPYYSVPLYQDRLGILMAARDPLAAEGILTIPQILDRDFLLDSSDCEMHTHLENAFARYGKKPRIRMEGTNLSDLFRAVDAGQVVMLLSESCYDVCARRLSDDPYVAFRPFQEPELCRSVAVTTLPCASMQPATTQFCQEILQHFF